jgi:hypothetical protein
VQYYESIILFIVFFDCLSDLGPVAHHDVRGIDELLELKEGELYALVVRGLRSNKSISWEAHLLGDFIIVEAVELLEALCKSSLDHIALGSLDHAKGAACANDKHLRNVLVQKVAFSLLLLFELEVAIVCQCVAGHGFNLRFSLAMDLTSHV